MSGPPAGRLLRQHIISEVFRGCLFVTEAGTISTGAVRFTSAVTVLRFITRICDGKQHIKYSGFPSVRRHQVMDFYGIV